MSMLPEFKGHDNDNPYVHVRDFEKVVNSFYPLDQIETARLKFFPLSLKDRAKGWLSTLKPRSIGNWGTITREFCKKFFPPHKIQSVKRKISSFIQKDNESLFSAWGRYKDLFNLCPPLGYEDWRLVYCFYEGLKPSDKQFLQLSFEGGFLNIEPKEAMNYLDELFEKSNIGTGLNIVEPTDRFKGVTSIASGSVSELTVNDHLRAKDALLIDEVEVLTTKGSEHAMNQGMVCNVCGDIDHYTEDCNSPSLIIEVPEEPIYLFNHNRQTDDNTSYFCSSNSRSPPSLSSGNEKVFNLPPHAPPVSSSLEDTFSAFMTYQMEQNKEQDERVSILEEKVMSDSSITEQGQLPAQTQPDSSHNEGKGEVENLNVVTTSRSGEESVKDELPESPTQTPSRMKNDVCPFPTPFPQALQLLTDLDTTTGILDLSKLPMFDDYVFEHVFDDSIICAQFNLPERSDYFDDPPELLEVSILCSLLPLCGKLQYYDHELPQPAEKEVFLKDAVKFQSFDPG
ncbi:ATPdependent RNA helicase [Dionaea muscipula]